MLNNYVINVLWLYFDDVRIILNSIGVIFYDIFY